MSMSLRDQLLKAGLITKAQADDAERQRERVERQSRGPVRKPHPAGRPNKPPPVADTRVPAARATPAMTAQAAKMAKDHEAERRKADKARRKALAAQVRQLVEQNRLPPVEEGQLYNFLDGSMVRRITVNAAIRERLARGDIVIVRHGGGYAFVPAAVANRIREQQADAFVFDGTVKETVVPADDAYGQFAVPDDLIW